MSIQILAITFLAIYQLSSRIDISPRVGAALVIAMPLALGLILSSVFDATLLGWHDIVVAVLLYGAYFFIFHQSQHHESVTSWIIYGVSGLVLIPIAAAACLGLLRPLIT